MTDKEKLELLKSIIEVVPQYKYTACNVLQIKIKQDLIYNDTFALLVKSIVEDKDIKDLLKEFPMIHYEINKEEK